MFGEELRFIRKGFMGHVHRIMGDLSVGRRVKLYALRNIFDAHIGPTDTILDGGCGRGLFSLYLAKQHPAAHVTGIDYDTDAIQDGNTMKRRASIQNVTFEQGDLRTYRRKRGYDVVVSINATHYCGDEDIEIFRRFHDSLKDDGTLILVAQKSLYEGIFPKRRLEQKISKKRKEQKYTKEELFRKVKDAGFVVDRRMTITGTAGSFLRDIWIFLERVPPLFIITFPFAIFLARLDPYLTSRRGSNWVIIAHKKEEDNRRR